MSSRLSGHVVLRFAAGAVLGFGALILSLYAVSQTVPEPKEIIREGYAVH